MRPVADDDLTILIPWLLEEAVQAANSDAPVAASKLTLAAQLLGEKMQRDEDRAALEADLERERMRLAVCGVVAMANTAGSAAQARDCHPDYWSASANDVAKMVDEQMRLREELKGRDKAVPVPTAKRLPNRDDLDANAYCWLWDGSSWERGNTIPMLPGGRCAYTHWLPHWALPLPEA